MQKQGTMEPGSGDTMIQAGFIEEVAFERATEQTRGWGVERWGLFLEET